MKRFLAVPVVVLYSSVLQSSVPLRSIFGKSLIIFRIIGLIHFDIHHSVKDGFQSRISFVGTLFAAANILGIVTLLVINEINPPLKVTMSNLRASWVDTLLIRFSDMIGPLVLLVHWSKMRTLSSMIKTVLDVDCKLYGLTRQPLNRAGFCNAGISLAFQVFTLSVGLAITIMLNYFATVSPAFFIASGWSKFVVLMSNYQLVVLLVVVSRRFETLNRLLFRNIQLPVLQTNFSRNQHLTDRISTEVSRFLNSPFISSEI